MISCLIIVWLDGKKTGCVCVLCVCVCVCVCVMMAVVVSGSGNSNALGKHTHRDDGGSHEC